MAATHGLGTYGNGVGTVTPEDHKLAQAGLVTKNTTGAIRAGVFWSGNATLITGTAGMSYDVAAFTAATTRGAASGAVLLTNNGTVNVTTTAAPGSNSRYDVVYIWQREFALDGTDSEPVIGVIQGTTASSPTAPSLAAFPGAIELARILVPAGVTATNTGTTITQTAPFTAAAGGTIVFRTLAEMDAVTNLPHSTPGWVLADNSRHYFDGAWKLQASGAFAEASEEATVTSSTGSGSSVPFYWSGTQSVTFPVGSGFTVPPKVTGSPSGNASGTILPGLQFQDITTTGFTFRVFRIDSAPAIGTKITYRAVQQTATTA